MRSLRFRASRSIPPLSRHPLTAVGGRPASSNAYIQSRSGAFPLSGANAALQPSAAAGKCALSGCMARIRPASSNAYIQSRGVAFPPSGANAALQPSAAAGKCALSGCMARIRPARPRLLQPEAGQCGAAAPFAAGSRAMWGRWCVSGPHQRCSGVSGRFACKSNQRSCQPE